jgi:ATP-citrate lyase beta-subunit
MPRKQLSEYRAKALVYAALDELFEGFPLIVTEKDWGKSLTALDGSRRYVVKVDQATKGRFKKGLVKLDRTPAELFTDIIEMSQKGYTHFIVEPYATHEGVDEYYISLGRTAAGVDVSASAIGGIDVESNQDKIKTQTYESGLALPEVGLSTAQLAALVKVFEDNYFSFLEINPLIITDGHALPLDAAVEVDDAAEFFVRGNWSADDLRSYSTKTLTPEERAVRELNEQSQASFNLEVLNPDGGLFLLLSGGGASVVVADEVNNLGEGDLLANYGEYSGGPNREETKVYTEQLLSLLLKSKAKQKILIIAGGVANFTDVKATFAGVIDALQEHEADLREQHVKLYVRRGGPNEIVGLQLMREYLESAGILGAVYGPELVLADIVQEALAEVEAAV